jgi:threonine dehydrogenase-like Zn-dependent dehydrogenase
VFKGPGLVFVGERDCKVEEVAIDESSLEPGGVVVAVDVSVISAGTETANFTGLDPGTRVPGSWNYYPYHPGYGAIGNVVAVGPPSPGSAPAAAVGQRVFAICPHARFGVVDTARRPVVPLRADDDARSFVLARMASVSITSVRKASHVQFGANAVVVGLGLVGNFAAQLLQLAGMNVLGLDRIPHRVDMAATTGLDAVLVKGGDEAEAVSRRLAARPDLVVEASGVPDSVPIAVSLAGDGAEVILLGSPRGVYGGDATAMLSEVHRRGIQVIGALEWLLPVKSGPWQSRWSLYDDYLALFDAFRDGRIKTTGLVTDVVPPDRAQEVYTRLAEREPGIGGVLFDWKPAA